MAFLLLCLGGRSSICTREHTMADLVRAYVDYMQRNPEMLEADKRVGVRLALENAFPCPAVDLSTGRRLTSHRDRL